MLEQPESQAFSKLSILMAAYNEEATLRRCLERILAVPLPGGLQKEIVLVDDCSTDATWKIARQMAAKHEEVKAYRQDRNQGKGAAIRRAIAEMTGQLAIFQDADLEYDPLDYHRLLRPLLLQKADVVFGSRFTGEERKVLYFWHTAGNRLLTLLANMLNDTNLTDMETCYKAFVADHLKKIPLESNRFGIEPEITKYRFSSKYADAGKVALDALEQAPRFNQWMYQSIRPYLGDRVVELGAGKGNLSKLLKQHAAFLMTDYRSDYLEELLSRWEHLDHVQVAQLDLRASADYDALRRFNPDTVVCLNVLEHIEDDRFVMKLLHETVPPGCRLVFLVPYNPKLFSEFDRQIGHFRRYAKGELEQKMEAAGFTVERQFFFNKVGVLAWWIGNTLFGQRSITGWQLKLYNLLTPLFRLLDRVLPTNGLSTVVVARRPESK